MICKHISKKRANRFEFFPIINYIMEKISRNFNKMCHDPQKKTSFITGTAFGSQHDQDAQAITSIS